MMGMARTVSLKDVIQRRKEIAAEIAQLQAEDAELEVAARALERLLGQAETPIGAAFVKAAPLTVTERPTPQKPDDIPTMPQMITLALKDAVANGKSGLGPAEITSFIKKTWWPEVDINKVGPIAWRMWQRKELTKRGSKYSLKNETPSGGEGASKVTGEVSASPNENRNGLFGRNG
jgi:hypothetical protein